MVTKTQRRPSNVNEVSQETGDSPATPQTQPQHDTIKPRKGMTGADLLKAARPTNRLLAKQTLMTTVSSQTLAEVADIQAGDAEQNARSADLASSAAFQLFTGLINGLVTAPEVTTILGNQFGWRKKGDAKVMARNSSEAATTPYGYGETIRKRITRAAKAHAFANGGEPDNFFKVLDPNEVKEDLQRVEAGDLSIFTLYDDLDAYRKEVLANDNPDGPVNAAFNPSKVLKLVQALTEEGAVDAFAESPALLIAYASVTEAVEAITEAAYGA
jgi:hypothetical protein